MKNQVVLILVDGMRPDGMTACGHPFVEKLLKTSAYTLKGRTVMPSVTLPCHMSLFHSVDPGRHGVTTNTYTPQVRPVVGLDHQIDAAGLKSAHFLTWEELRDLSRPDELSYCLMINQHKFADTDIKITDAAIPYLTNEAPDFSFVYLGETDEVGGHSCGWMSETYLHAVNKAMGCIERIVHALPEETTVIVIADHGGHDRCHGTDLPEDMTIPVVIHGSRWQAGRDLGGVSIKDIAPTVAALLGVATGKEWEGTPITPDF